MKKADRIAAVLLALPFFSPAICAAARQDAGTLKVCVKASAQRQGMDPARLEQERENLEQKVARTEDERKSLEKKLKAAFGKNRQSWPPEKRIAYRAAEDASAQTRAQLTVFTSTVSQKQLDESAAQIRRILAAGKVAQVTDQPGEAQLVIDVVGRSSLESEYKELLVRFEAGGKLDPSALANIPDNWGGMRLGRGSSRTHSYSPDAPYWEYYAWGSVSDAEAAKTVSGMVEKLVKEDYLKLASMPGRQR